MPRETYLGFDFGQKRIGIAVGQGLTKTATALTQVDSIDWKAIKNLIEEWRPTALIIGLPLNMDDSEGKMSTLAKQFAKKCSEQFNLPTHLVDERLSSRAAIERLQELGINKPSKDQINSTAAAIILESWLNQ